ncbi:MAG: radical SAM protein [Pseudomonadota bacterium]
MSSSARQERLERPKSNNELMNNLSDKSGYQRLWESGELEIRMTQALEILSHCTLCPRACRANRFKGEKGFCGAGNAIEIAHFGPHFGEEPPLTGEKGAGTIFFTHCTLKCSFCQNHQISQKGMGYEISEEKLADVMLQLQDMGCHNIDLVTPTHYLPFILKAITIAAARGLYIPLVYNSGGYESIETLKLLDGIIDMYLPDWKYGETELGKEYSKAPDYPLVCHAALREMYRQVGDLVVDEHDIARKGLIVRHLVLPNHLSNSEKVLSLIVKALSPSVRVSLMSQYVPRFQAQNHPCLNRSLLPEEYQEVTNLMERFDFDEYWIQELESREILFPDFTRDNPFSLPGA